MATFIWHSLKKKLKAPSLKWRHFLMMICIFSIAIIALVISNEKTILSLTNENLKTIQTRLDQDCLELNNSIYMTSAIPSGIENTKYFEYIKAERSGHLAAKHYPVLSYIKNALNNQVYLKGDNEECLIYIPGCNCIATEKYNFPIADDCFRKYIVYNEIDSDTIMELLKTPKSLFVLPMQSVKYDNEKVKECLSVIIHPRDNDMAVMTLYSSQYIQNCLGLQQYSGNASIKMLSGDGDVLFQSQIPDEINQENCSFVRSTLKDFNITVEMSISQAYFDRLLHQARTSGYWSITVVLLVGLIMALFFSEISVLPLRRLLKNHEPKTSGPVRNEILCIDQLLNDSRKQIEETKQQLTQQLLARAISGAVLSEYDSMRLDNAIRDSYSEYRIVIFHVSSSAMLFLNEYLQQISPLEMLVYLSDVECGLLIPNESPLIEKLKEIVYVMNCRFDKSECLCGISSEITKVDEIHVAAIQARMALSKDNCCFVYQGSVSKDTVMPWIHHERLFQSIIFNDLEETRNIIHLISEHINHSNARETYYSVSFTIKNAFSNLGITAINIPEYSEILLPSENFSILPDVINGAFAQLQEIDEEKHTEFQNSVLTYIEKSISQYDLNASSVADYFQIPVTRIYEIIRNTKNQTFKEYLTTIRMEKSADLLCNTTKSINDISSDCGYLAISTFYRLFQDYYNVSPGQYRKTHIRTDR